MTRAASILTPAELERAAALVARGLTAEQAAAAVRNGARPEGAEVDVVQEADDAAPPLRLPRLPPEFWAARPVLEHIRDAAWSRLRAPDAVLHAVMARVAAFRPPMMQVDTGIASPASLNLLCALVDPSGGGKSSAEKIARQVLPAPPEMEDADGLPIGSGEGIAEAYMGTVAQPRDDDPAKTEKVRKQVRYNVLAYVDEGQALARLAERSGSTLGETLRRAFNGETLGQSNASADRNRRVSHYSFGLVVGMQPEAALGLLADAPYGTPQRFLWCSVVDPTIPDDPPPWPGTLRVRALERFEPLDIDPDICAELRRQDLARQRGELRRDPLDAHEPLVRVKLAAILALLDGRTHIGPEDWRLASVAWETSCAVRDALVTYGRALELRRERRELRVHARRAVAADRAVERERANVVRVAQTLARRLLRHGSATQNDLRRAVASQDRRYLERAIAHALSLEWIVQDEAGRYWPGRYPTEAL